MNALRRLRARARRGGARHAAPVFRKPTGVTLAAALVATTLAPVVFTNSASVASATQIDSSEIVQGQDATTPPKIVGRISDRHATDGDGIDVRARVRSADGSVRSLVTLRARRAGTKLWRTVARRHVSGAKKFTLTWRGADAGRYLLRINSETDRIHSTDALGPAFAYRRSFASWYGPGFYGRRTACGQTLTGAIVGVANKSLPCGTPVTFRLHGRTVTARVIDRGPFVADRQWDLSPALKRKLHFGSTGHVHATS